MALNRWVVVGLVGVASLGTLGIGGQPASADAAPNEPQRPRPNPLPPRIHQKANGRYVRDMCDAKSQRFHCLARQLLPEGWRPGDPMPDFGKVSPESTSAQAILAAAYSIPSTAAANGKIVAILDSPDSHALTDLTAYRSKMSLPAMARCGGMPTGSGTACFAQVAEDGSASTNTDPNADADGETSLDMDMISAACPDCSILLVEINPNFCESDMLAGAATATKVGASAISISLGGPEATDPNLAGIDAGPQDGGEACATEATWTNDAPGPYSSPGHLVFVAAGDFAYDNVNIGLTATLGGASPSYPASSPYVVAVGGTALYDSQSSTSTYGEGVWDDGRFGLVEQSNPLSSEYQDVTTSGCSTEFAMPPWQASVLAGSGCKMRATADMSAVSTFFQSGTEVGIEIVLNGTAQAGVEGTSAASPFMAALYTRLGLTTEVSNDLSWNYTNMAAFNDVGSSAYPLPSGASLTDAPSGSSCGILCTAGTGWDGPSGAGSPNGTKLAALPVSTGGPQPYPDAGVCGPFGACGAGGSSSGGEADGGDEDSGSTGTGSGSGGGSGGGSGSGSGGGSGGGEDAGDAAAGGSGGSSSGGGSGSSGGGCAAGGQVPSSGLAWLGVAAGLVALGARRRRGGGR